jgi:hypothetical protein
LSRHESFVTRATRGGFTFGCQPVSVKILIRGAAVTRNNDSILAAGVGPGDAFVSFGAAA